MSAQAQAAPEPPLQAHHFAVIDFVVITGQVNHPVQDQHAQFCRQPPGMFPGVSPRRFG
jgi:hypothetical protein